jgi:hypothetical protein
MNEQKTRKWIEEYFEMCKNTQKGIEKAEKIVKNLPTDENNTTNMDKLKEYLKEREQLIKDVLSQLFKGNSVVIPQVLSLRHGEFRHYRQQYKLGLLEVKKIIMNYINYINENLDDEKMEILEFCLKCIGESRKYEYDGYDDEDFYDILKMKWKDKEILLDEPLWVDSDGSDGIIDIHKIIISPTGDISFYDDDDNKRFWGGNSGYLLMKYYFKDKILKVKQEFSNEMKDYKIQLEKQIEEIKNKCSKYLLVASLSKEIGK